MCLRKVTDDPVYAQGERKYMLYLPACLLHFFQTPVYTLFVCFVHFTYRLSVVITRWNVDAYANL